MRQLRFAGFATLALLLLAGAAPLGAADDYGYELFDSRQGETRFLDTLWTAPVLPDLGPEGVSQPFELPFDYPFYGRTYRHIVVSEDGWIGLVGDAPRPAGTFVEQAGSALSRGLATFGSGSRSPEIAAAIEVLARDWVQTPTSRVQVQDDGRRFVVRWVRMATPDASATVTFEVILHPEGAATFQILEARGDQEAMRQASIGTRPEGSEGTDLGAELDRLGGGLSLSVRPPRKDLPPEIAHLDGDCPDLDGDTQPDNDFPSWCDTNTNPNCSVNAGMADSCTGTDCTACTETEATVWRFNETAFCEGCVHTFFILVECGTEMHMPFQDMEGARIRVFDALTGDPLGIRAENECFKDSIDPNPPYPISEWYCDACDIMGNALGIFPREQLPVDLGGGVTIDENCNYTSPLGNGTAPTLACDIFEVDTTPAAPGVCWGARDNCASGWPASPCIDSAACPGGSGTNPQFDGQETDVVLTDMAGLCGVFRVEIVSGGFEWNLFANCDGTDQEQFRIFRNCGDALTAWNPLPEYILDDIVLTGDCPSSPNDPNRPQVEVTLRNIGCCDESGDAGSNPCQNPVGNVPVTVLFEDPDNPGTVACPGPNPDQSWTLDFDAAQLPQKSGATLTNSLPYNCDASTLPVRAIVTLDPTAGPGDPGAVQECSEAPGAASCGSQDVAILDVDVCACDFFLVPDLVGPSEACLFEDPGNPGSTVASVDLDASGSFANPACPNPEYRFYRLDPAEVNNPDPNIRRIDEVTPDPANPTAPMATDVTFSCSEGQPFAFEVEYACADETIDPQGCPKFETITGICGSGTDLGLTADIDFDGDPESETICSNQPFELTGLLGGSVPPTANVVWRAESRDCADITTPGPEVPEAMDNCTQNAHILTCDGLPEGVGCGECIVYVADTQNQRGCDVSDFFNMRIVNDNDRHVGCNFKVSRGDFDSEGDGLDLRFTHEYPSPPIVCPGSPSSEVVEYACTGPDYSTCGPNGLPPGNGPFDLTNMAQDGMVIGFADNGASTVIVEEKGGFGSDGQRTMTYFQIRANTACGGPGPLGLPGSPGSFFCN